MRRLYRTRLAAAALVAAGASLGVAAPASAHTTCVYTQGYYKTHYTNAQIASVNLFPSVVAGILNKTGATDLASLYWTAPKGGNANIIAAHQLVTTALNGSAGESGFSGSDPVSVAFNALGAYFEGNLSLTRDQVLAYAATLDAYNNGLLGVPHCG